MPVNASQTPEMQAAQNISQVFMGVNLKCASCHDSFINDRALTDSYGLASVLSAARMPSVTESPGARPLVAASASFSL